MRERARCLLVSDFTVAGWAAPLEDDAAPPAGLVGIPLRGLHLPTSVNLLWRRDEQDPGVRAVLDAFAGSNPLPAGVV